MKIVSSHELADIIDFQTKRIQSEWLLEVQKHIAASRMFNSEAIASTFEMYIRCVAQDLRHDKPSAGSYESLAPARAHSATRTHMNYEAKDVSTEYTLLREILVRMDSQTEILQADVSSRLNRVIDAGMTSALEEFLNKAGFEAELTHRISAENSQDQLHDFFMQAPDPMVILSGPEHIFKVANAPYVQFIGRNPIGKKVREVFTHEEAGGFFEILDQVFTTGTPRVGKEMLFKKPNETGDLQDHWINIGYYPARSRAGEIVGIHAFVNDVTEQVRIRNTIESAKNSIEHERQNFENLFEQTPEMVCSLEGPEHRFRFVNKAHIRVLGFDATGLTVREAQPESIEVHGILDDVYKTGKTAELFEIPVTVTDRIRYFNLTYAARRNIENEIDGIMILGAEVTEQVLNREALKLQGKALELSMEDAPLPDILHVLTSLVEVQTGNTLMASVLVADESGKTLSVAAASRLPAAFNAAVNGMEIGPDVGSCGTAAYFKKIVVASDIRTDPHWQNYRDLATEFNLGACWSVPILSSRNRLLGTFAVYSEKPKRPSTRDLEVIYVAVRTTALVMERRIEIEERLLAASEAERAREEAERANAAKSAFLANMSHEIRTPLGAIKGFADLARQDGATREDNANFLAIVERNSTQVLRIIDDILDLAKVEAGRVEIENVVFSLTDFLADFTSLIGFRARENAIGLKIKATSDLPDLICSDPTRLRQILTNAVGNAIKFTARGSVIIHVAYAQGVLSFGIEDTGRGISKDQAEKLFHAFVQADVSTTRKYGGTGLGLVLTKRLCQLMGGDYVLERSEPGVGSRFDATVKISLPSASTLVSSRDMKFQTALEPRAEINPERLDDIRVLLVEDSPDNQVLVKRILERQGAKVDIAADGLSGVNQALSQDYQVVLMDIQMPQMDGHEAVQTLRERGYKKPVIALTAHAMKEEADRARMSGFTRFLTKPIQREALIALIRDVCGNEARV